MIFIILVFVCFALAMTFSGHATYSDNLRVLTIGGVSAVAVLFAAWMYFSVKSLSRDQNSYGTESSVQRSPYLLHSLAALAMFACASCLAISFTSFANFRLVECFTVVAILIFAKLAVRPNVRWQWICAMVLAGCLAFISLKHGFTFAQIGAPTSAALAFIAFNSFEPVARERVNSTIVRTNEKPYEMPAARIQKAVKGPGFDAVAGMVELKEKLINASTESVRFGSKQTRNGILLHGEPGNGKTFIVEALAQHMKLPLITLTYGEVGSMWVGETTQNVMSKINLAKQSAPCVLFIDEADSLLTSRGKSPNSGDQDRTVNTLLTEIVNLRGTGVVVVAATNYIEQLDAAAIREGRFDFKIEITTPDLQARIALLKSGIARHARKIKLDDALVLSAATRWNGFSVKRILAVAEQIPSYAARTGKTKLDYDDLKAVLREVQGSKGLPPEGTKSLNDLAMSVDQRKALTGLALRLQKSFEIEQAGGSMPSGLLFSGPPGTGKTETARALAKESGWAFMSTSGTDLITDASKMDKLWKDAMNLRPAIIFVDEADDLLMNREHSAHGMVTNKFLTVMDGPKGKIPDLLWIAATNFPERLDPAALRGGRFTEKIEFAVPEQSVLADWIATWLSNKGWSSKVPTEAIANALEGQSIANVAAILQQSINNALTNSFDMTIRQFSSDDFENGVRSVTGAEIMAS